LPRRYGEPFYGSRYIGVEEERIVHDLDYESDKCCIDELLENHRTIPFTPDTIEQANMEGYNNCVHCLGVGEKY
jgi:hypothetical protein